MLIRSLLKAHTGLLFGALAVIGCASSPAPAPATAPTTPPPANPPAATPSTPTAQTEETPAPTPTAPAAFTPSAEDIAAWQHATTVLDFNGQANAGGGALTTGFTPDPWGFPLTAGGGRNPINVADLNIKDAHTGETCGRSFVTRRPDFHFTFQAGTTFPLLRFYVVTENGADATLVINDPQVRWRCNDDNNHEGWNGRMPVIDFHNPPPGRYDVWVGTYDASRNNRATLYVTEVESNHP